MFVTAGMDTLEGIVKQHVQEVFMEKTVSRPATAITVVPVNIQMAHAFVFQVGLAKLAVNSVLTVFTGMVALRNAHVKKTPHAQL